MHLVPRSAIVCALTCFAALTACGLNPIVVGPPDLDTTSAAAPRCPTPQYPFNALESAEKGTAVVVAEVAPDGRVAGVSMDTPTYSTHLNDASLSVVRYCRFQPSTRQEPHKVKVTVVWDFVGRDDKLYKGVVRIGVQPSLQAGL